MLLASFVSGNDVNSFLKASEQQILRKKQKKTEWGLGGWLPQSLHTIQSYIMFSVYFKTYSEKGMNKKNGDAHA